MLLLRLLGYDCSRFGLRNHCELILLLQRGYTELVSAPERVFCEDLRRLCDRVVARDDAIFAGLRVLRLN